MKRVLALVMGMVMLAVLCACGKEPEKGKAGAEPALDPNYSTTIYVCGSWGNFEALDTAAQLLRKQYPNVEVTYNQLSAYGTDLMNRFATGEGVDIYMADWLLSNDERYQHYWSRAEDLTGQLDFSAVPAEYLETGLREGHQFALPIYANYGGLMVNEDLLKTYGLSVPTTFA
ncbi:MAG: ABC transporter substrate-binding protein [Clostridia bacterium]|nr:ABC transporter substrate-binding protein [Clostridia bacterium]